MENSTITTSPLKITKKHVILGIIITIFIITSIVWIIYFMNRITPEDTVNSTPKYIESFQKKVNTISPWFIVTPEAIKVADNLRASGLIVQDDESWYYKKDEKLYGLTGREYFLMTPHGLNILKVCVEDKTYCQTLLQ